jgi:hypothetical protein
MSSCGIAGNRLRVFGDELQTNGWTSQRMSWADLNGYTVRCFRSDCNLHTIEDKKWIGYDIQHVWGGGGGGRKKIKKNSVGKTISNGPVLL